jgi:hypothetical protein
MPRYAVKTIIFLGVLFFGSVFLSSKVSAGNFKFTPASASFPQGCSEEVVVMVDPEGSDSNSADIEISFDPTKVQINDANPSQSGTQVITGDAYEAYVFNNVTSPGILKVAAASFMNTLTTNKTFIKIPFQSIGGTVSANFTINFTGPGDTLDSNIAETTTSNDLLTSVVNGSYTFTVASCIADTTPPPITYNYPTNGSNGIPSNAIIKIIISDTQSGVDINTVQVIVNGITYQNGDPGFSFTGTPSSYTIFVDPLENIPQGNASTIVTTAKDLAGNQSSKIITFNIPQPPLVTVPVPGTPVPTDNTPPAIIEISPAPSTEIPLDQSFMIKLKDDTGINLNTLILILNNTQYSVISPQLTYTGNPLEYDLILNPTTDLPPGTDIYMTIFIKDVNGNSAIKTLFFKTLGELPSTGCSCTPSVTPTPGGGPGVTPLPITPQVITDFINQIPAPVKEQAVPAALVATSIVAGVFNLLAYPRLLLYAIGWFRERNRYQTWGIVYDRRTRKPIPFATVRVYSNGEFLKERVTDFSGKYGFQMDKGSYNISVEHSEYNKYEKSIELKEDNAVVSEDIGMQPKNNLNEGNFDLRSKIKDYIRKLSNYSVYIGLAFSVFATIVSPVFFNFLVLFLYALQFGLVNYIKRRSRKNWGKIYSSDTMERIPGAFVRIFDKKDGTQIDVQMTDERGRFGFNTKKGLEDYYLNAYVNGFKFPSDQLDQTSLHMSPTGEVFIDTGIQSKSAQGMAIPVDPTGEKTSPNIYMSPF